MKILIFNPNTSDDVTEKIRIEALKYACEDLIIDVKKAPIGPIAIETSYDEVIAAYVTVEELKKIEDEYDAFVIACFADPGLKAARSILKTPVIGLFEASLYELALKGNRFSIISSCGNDDISAFIELVRSYGFFDRLASVKYLGVGVNGVSEDIKNVVKEEIQKCIFEDGADSIILGCAAFSGFGDVLTKELNVNITDGIKSSIYFAKMMIEWNDN